MPLESLGLCLPCRVHSYSGRIMVNMARLVIRDDNRVGTAFKVSPL